MFTLLICHRRGQGQRYPAFHTHWLQQRSQLVTRLKPQLQYDRYTQLHQAPRVNLLYQGILLTRSPVVTKLLTGKSGTPKSWRDRQTQREERWDLVEQFDYACQDALVAAFTSAAGQQAAQQLVRDQTSTVRRTAIAIAERFAAVAAPALGYPRANILFCLRRSQSLTRAAMLDYWGTHHKTLVQSVQPALGYQAYDQLHVRSHPAFKTIIGALGSSVGEPFDGIAALTYGSESAVTQSFLSLRSQWANFQLVKDETTFLDLPRSALVFGQEYAFE